ncbi:type VI secretion system accessory protein TagJ [Variovorax ureilyticus]|uniref:Type VI secretion system accessory protein TagJ n=1 Tax=Variovorax ureilyticus TaxID=1836198 RepID=A0ABU8VBJ0_9BURK
MSEALSRAEAGVRAKPQEARARWLLFELLCVLGQWERALKQLQAWAGSSRDNESTAHVMRGLIRAEHRRAELFGGRAEPATLTASGTSAAAWMAGLGEALTQAAAGGAAALEAADLAREAALAQAPETAGGSNLMSFAWVTDTDTRLGPVCEVLLAGAYRWLAFSDLASISKAAPAHLLDLVWAQVDLVLRDGTALKGYMPMRYPVHAGDRDALLMARETVWTDVGRTGVVARGQKMWATDAGDVALLDLRDCRFANNEQPSPGEAAEGGSHAAG